MKEKPSLFRRLLAHTMLLGNIIAVLWLLLCLAASYISPGQARFLALFSLTTPFAFGVNIFYIFFWLFSSRKSRVFFSIIAIAISYKLLTSVFGWNYFSNNDMQADANSIKIMTWNVHGMGIYDRPQNPKTDDNIIDFIKEQSPDILFLPEFYTIYSNALKPYSTAILNKCGYREFRFKDDNSIGAKIYIGTAIFSKYPVSEFKNIQLSRYVYLLQCDVKLPSNKILRTYFIHLESFHLTDGDKSYIEAVKHRNKDLGYSKFKYIVKQFGVSYYLRSFQVDSAAGIIAKSPYPTVVCGDFNDVPGSYTYTKMKGNLCDAFAAKGRGFGRTFNLFLPTIRIDYILYDPALLKLKGFKSPRNSNSDHNPVIANFELQQTP